MNRPQIEAELQSYVKSAAMPCPYARLPTSYLYLDEDIEMQRTRQQLKNALSAFWPDESKSILSVIPATQPTDHPEARKQAYWLRYHLEYLHMEAKGLLKEELEGIDSRIKLKYSNWISDTLTFLGPRLIIGQVDIMMTALNPLYDKEHSRYAPHTVFPVIRSKDLLAIHDRKPDISFKIAAHAKSKIILSMIRNRDGIEIGEMQKEYTEWLNALSYYRNFVMTTYTESYRIDPRTLPHLRENREISRENMESGRFKASLVAFRVIVNNDPNVPTLKRILAQNPDVTVFDIAKVVYGDVSGMYVLPS